MIYLCCCIFVQQKGLTLWNNSKIELSRKLALYHQSKCVKMRPKTSEIAFINVVSLLTAIILLMSYLKLDTYKTA